VADAGGNFAGEDGGDEFVAARLAKNKRSAGNELAAAGKENDVFEEAQGTGAAAILVVDLAIDVIRVRQINQFGAMLEEAVVPAVEAHASGGAGPRFGIAVQVEQHELPGVELEALLAERGVDRTAEGHELRFDSGKLRESTHGVEHFFQKAAADIGLWETLRDVEAADQAFLLFEDVEGIAGGGAVFESDAAAEGVGFEKTLDEVERAAVVPMQLIMPVARFFLEERLELADTGLPKVENIHGRRAVPQRRFMIAETAAAARKGRNTGVEPGGVCYSCDTGPRS